ncbi:MAG: TnpV protein [Lachnospiraceae bacterium]|nr:TnpV protein [Lachnospiraceae bacterium]MCI8996911.1 TnpV protein [Lachnospiraceae bacterium]MCI9135823.1 TnpV protein [Lachnospiraceae bacterium]
MERCLSEIDQQAENMFSQLVNQIAEREGITEQLKEDS